MESGIEMTGTTVDYILEGVNKYMLALDVYKRQLLSHARLSSNILQIVPVMDGIHSRTDIRRRKIF